LRAAISFEINITNLCGTKAELAVLAAEQQFLRVLI